MDFGPVDLTVPRLEELQADLAFRVEHLVGEARAARLHLQEARERLDAWSDCPQPWGPLEVLYVIVMYCNEFVLQFLHWSYMSLR